MRKIGNPQPVMLFVGMLSGETSLMNEVAGILQKSFGPLVHQTEDLPWDFTDYYAEEMGEDLFRKFLFFENLILPDQLAKIKIETYKIEEEYSRLSEGRRLRRVNLDPGYLDAPKIVLASIKDYSHRVYLGRGIYAEVVLTFVHESFRSSDHTYPDYRSSESIELFNRMRDGLMNRR